MYCQVLYVLSSTITAGLRSSTQQIWSKIFGASLLCWAWRCEILHSSAKNALTACMSPSQRATSSIDCADDESLKTFESALKWFSVSSNTVACIVKKRWPDGIVRCPVCGGKEIRYLPSREVW